MPRVSEAHLAARRQQILDAAQVCFMRNGFHTTTMHDVIAEANLSVGAVYRYFSSKSDLVEAIAVAYADQIWDQAAPLIESDRPLVESMRAVIGFVDTVASTGGPIRLAIQVWAEAMRDERIAATTKKVYIRFRGNFVTMAARAIQSGQLPPGTDPAAAGAALFSLAIGYGLQKALTGSPDLATYAMGLRAVLTDGSDPRPS